MARLGQHFLSDPRVLERIADALELTGAETVVEIGPGLGSLTDVLARRASRLVAVELDGGLAGHLRTRYAGQPHVSIVEADVLTIRLADLGGERFVLAGNVPYYITTPILFHALQRPRPARAVYLVQREVAERVVAAPGSKVYGALSVNVQAVARAELLFGVRAGSFRPPPQVESAVIRIVPRDDPVVPPEDEVGFRTLVQQAFALRRKQMRRVVRTIATITAPEADDVLQRAGVTPDARPETLSPEQFAALNRAIDGE